jgi:undecaprenyl-diphosphatase
VSPATAAPRRGLGEALHRLDAELFRRTVERHDPVLDRTLPALSRAADFSVLWFGVAAVLARVDRPGWRRGAVRGVAAIALASTTANLVVKGQYGRARPPLQTVPVHRRVRRVPVTTSFPSGHSASAVAFAAAAGREAPELALPLGLVAAAVAWSRVWTGAHYPGDVVVGAAIGALAAAAVRPPPS